MKTHNAGIALAVIAALAVPAEAQEPQAAVRFERGPAFDDLAQLEDRIADLEARVAAIERSRAPRHPGGDAIERVALVADRAMRQLVEMVREWKRGPER